MKLTAIGALMAALALAGNNQKVNREANPISPPPNEFSQSPATVYEAPKPFEILPRKDNKFELLPKEGVTPENTSKQVPELPKPELIDISSDTEPVIIRSPKDILLDEMMEAWIKDDMETVDKIGRQIEEIECAEKEAEIYRMYENGELKF